MRSRQGMNPAPAKVRLAMLNSMAAPEIERSIALQRSWGIRDLDLKDRLFGRNILDLTDAEARRVRGLADAAGMAVNTLSTDLFNDDIEQGPECFRSRHLARVGRAAALGRVLKTHFIRLIVAHSSLRDRFGDAAEHLRARHPWVVPLYREAVDRLASAGFRVCIENEVHGCLFRTPEDVLGFFNLLDRPGAACFTYDIQNLWQAGGVFPSPASYERLRPVTGFIHLKGGMAETPAGPLVWRSTLADASWPVREVMQRVVADRVSPVVCLNPSHGDAKPGYDMTDAVRRDIAWLRQTVKGIA